MIIRIVRPLLLVALLLRPFQVVAIPDTSTSTNPQLAQMVATAIADKQDTFPDRTSEYKQMLADKALEAAREAEAARQAEILREQEQARMDAVQGFYGTLIAGTLGYSNGWGNCVNEPGVNNPGWGNPISWPVTSSEPWIGASALFYFNHVAVVTGIWSDGSIEVRQENSPGAPHRYSRNMFRGFR